MPGILVSEDCLERAQVLYNLRFVLPSSHAMQGLRFEATRLLFEQPWHDIDDLYLGVYAALLSEENGFGIGGAKSAGDYLLNVSLDEPLTPIDAPVPFEASLPAELAVSNLMLLRHRIGELSPYRLALQQITFPRVNLSFALLGSKTNEGNKSPFAVPGLSLQDSESSAWGAVRARFGVKDLDLSLV